MTFAKTVRMNLVKKMLADCAPDATARVATHSRVIGLNGKVYHPPKDNPLASFHVRKLVSQLEIDRDCAKKHFPNIPFGGR